jgi:hypothetical protein
MFSFFKYKSSRHNRLDNHVCTANSVNRVPNAEFTYLELLSSAVRAFWCRIHPCMRAITVGCTGKDITVYVYTDHEPSELIEEDVDCALTEIIADFHFRIGNAECVIRVFDGDLLHLKTTDKVLVPIYVRAEPSE